GAADERPPPGTMIAPMRNTAAAIDRSLTTPVSPTPTQRCGISTLGLGISELGREQAERMPGGIEHHPNTLPRLMVRDGLAPFERPGDSVVEIVDGDVEVHHHLLPTISGWPGRGYVVLLE